VQGSNPPHDGETEPGAQPLAAGHAVKTLADAAKRLRRQGRAVVADLQLHGLGVAQGDMHGGARSGVPECVHQQVAEQDGKQLPAAGNDHLVALLQFDLQSTLDGKVGELGENLYQQ